MMKIGITGGIGSGKSTVASVFEGLGIPVYYADTEAKKFLNYYEVKNKLAEEFGQSIFDSGEINRAALAEIVFNDSNALNKLNSFIHPMVRKDFMDWCEKNSNSPYVIIEAAILFENGFNDLVDKTLVIIAPLEERINRAQKRDDSSREQIESRINHQWPQEKLIELSDYFIDNSDYELVIPQILKLHEDFKT